MDTGHGEDGISRVLSQIPKYSKSDFCSTEIPEGFCAATDDGSFLTDEDCWEG